ncbi:MAG: ribonuclease J [Deltaproteobacteria bacterium]|nr:ribonuclease J [Deltaproteobacteria bacterium]
MEPLRIIPLGGLGEFGLNMMLIEYGESALAIDCGLMFPGADLLGIDLVVPDVSYLLENKKELLGIVLTHAHEDHIGALPYILRQLPVPVFGTRLTLGLLGNKLSEHGLDQSTDLREIRAAQPWDVGPFKLEGISVTHSLMDCVALAVDTPVGTIIHTGDFKIDNTPVNGELFDFQRFAAYGERGVQVVDLSERIGRTTVLSGRSMIHNAQIASDLGYLHLPDGVAVESEQWHGLARDRITFLTTGSQGEPLSALHRIALNDHKSIRIDPGDTVVLSSKFIPGNERAITNLINHLYRRGAEVHYERVSEIHVSGHASQEELKTMLRLTRPRYFVPIHGEYRHLVRHIHLAEAAGVEAENCFLLEDGSVLELTANGARKAAAVSAGRVFVDGKGVGDVEDVVIRDRRHLSEDGMVLAVMAIHQQTGDLVAGPDLISRGFMRAEDSEEVMERAKKIVLETLKSMNRETRTDPGELQEEVRKALRRYFNKTLERRPVVLPFIMET